jgi:hypothetical protein
MSESGFSGRIFRYSIDGKRGLSSKKSATPYLLFTYVRGVNNRVDCALKSVRLQAGILEEPPDNRW